MLNRKRPIDATGIVLAFVLAAAQVNADDLAKQAQNPIADLISLPLQNNTNFGLGPDDRKQNVLKVQPVWPFPSSATEKL